jgi:hypothetical protein
MRAVVLFAAAVHITVSTVAASEAFTGAHAGAKSLMRFEQQVQMHDSEAAVKKLKVAVAVFITDIASDGWRDALYVLAHSFKKAAAKSKHDMKLVALVPDDFPREKESILLDAGFNDVQIRPIPVLPSEIQREDAKLQMAHVQGDKSVNNTFVLALETVKYWGLAMTSYDKVLVTDADVIIFDPMDELFERDEDFVGTFDLGLDTGLENITTMPPVQGGFLLFQPNMNDFESIRQLTREGDWGGDGWKSSGIGWCYGGVGPDGLLAYYFNKDALAEAKRVTKQFLPEGLHKPGLTGSRMIAVDRAKYDVVVNSILLKELDASAIDHETAVSNVKSLHFTGNCIKPWTCSYPVDWFCEGLMKKWWDLRADLEEERGMQHTENTCPEGQYTPLLLNA